MTNEQIEQALQRVRDVLGNDVIGRDLIADIENPTKSNATFLYVSKDPASGDYASVAAALASILDASASNPYVIQVGPGVFEEVELDLSGKPYVDVRGSSIARTVIKPASGVQTHIFKVGGNNELSEMTIDGNGTASSAIAMIDGTGETYFFQRCDLRQLLVKNATTLISVTTTLASAPYGMIAQIKNVEFNGSYTTGLLLDNPATAPWTGTLVQNLVAYQNAPGSTIHVKGAQATLKLAGPSTIEDYSGSSTAIKMDEGGYAEVSNASILFFAKGLSIANHANTPTARLSNTKFIAGTVDIENLHASASGVFSGVATMSKVSNSSSSFTMMYQDLGTGHQVVSAPKWEISGAALPAAVAPLADPPTATAEDVANAVNDIISALQAAGLMAP